MQAHHAGNQSRKNDEDNPSQNQSKNQNRKKVWLIWFAISIDYFPIDNAIISLTRKQSRKYSSKHSVTVVDVGNLANLLAFWGSLPAWTLARSAVLRILVSFKLMSGQVPMVYFSIAPPWRYCKDQLLLFIEVMRSCNPQPSVRVICPDLGGFVSLICRSVNFKKTPSFGRARQMLGLYRGYKISVLKMNYILLYFITSYNRYLFL